MLTGFNEKFCQNTVATPCVCVKLIRPTKNTTAQLKCSLKIHGWTNCTLGPKKIFTKLPKTIRETSKCFLKLSKTMRGMCSPTLLIKTL